MAIMRAGQVQGKPPVIRSQIGAQGQIELGAKPLVEANDLALVLRAGALPAPLTIVEERSIGPILGHDSIHAGIVAGAVGVLLVVLIMVIYYRVSGLIAVGALALYVAFTLGGLALFGFTLTLPGMAGLPLSGGNAGDAHGLIFERIHAELQHGTSVPLPRHGGFPPALRAPIDAHV